MSEEVYNARFHVCLLMVPLIGVPLNKGQYMYNTQDQMEGLPEYTVRCHCCLRISRYKLVLLKEFTNELLKEKVAGCTFNGASVIITKSGGVTQQLQVKISRPVIDISCIAHRLQLAVLDAVKTS